MKTKPTLIVLLGLSIFSTTLIAAPPGGVSMDAAQREAFGIRTSSAVIGGEALSKPYPAKVAIPNAKLRVINAPLEGVVESLLVAEGEPVQAGQVLARIHSQGLLDLQAAYLASLTRRSLAAETLARDRKLHAEGIVAQRRLLESQSAYREANTEAARNRQALTLAGMPDEQIKLLARKQQLDTLLQVTSPIDGVVLQQSAVTGQRLAASDPLYQVGELSTLWIEIHVPLDEIGSTQAGTRVSLSGGLQAEVITVGRMVHGADQGVLVRAALSEGVEQLRPGQFVEARLAQSGDSQAIHLPAGALVRIGGSNHVFVERDGRFVAVPVEVLKQSAEQVVLNAELSAGEAVVTQGAASLKAALSAGAE